MAACKWASTGLGWGGGGVEWNPQAISFPPMSDSSAVGALAAAGGGVLFASGWLVWIDGVAAAANDYGFGTPGADWVPGILQTVALLMVNAITWSAMADGGFDDSVAQKVKAWVFVSFVFAFSGLIASTTC
ncbi:hypothetical protein EMIHUDRAFT_256871 [Emiliania huxleyi CCMP1516]|uniref:Uncharacterized protein n=2 Tax=Emiliania huxleyi TaxID=2903 RepID=A0A0D3IQ03_EMIH1|nr:hypothetical protein EMIHUDRAFT_256871 [Emiliania huxleyi CCMP1516]EOD13338.1 hypothetical protein EMIHUDRAFT_256871 [Emiliania huxleyi CCMP1516]|eukprot:XP_005765767.1 hypothetical protein EMIHUDRAFT_256871 [Emiliania huxleyi CCMP1516]